MDAAAASVLHLPNLVFHEAGHILFGLFGRFMTVLGGSLLQFVVPLVIAGAFLRQNDRFGAAVGIWWAGENLLDIAPYIADARRLQITLLGGRTGAEVEGHDWEFLLTEIGWLHLDQTLGMAARRIGLAIMVAAIVWAAGLLWKTRRMRSATAAVLLVFIAAPASAQSLHLNPGEGALEVTAGWSVGPSSNGLELTAGGSLRGRIDVGLTFARYTYTFDDGSKSTFSEYAPFVRYFAFKERHGAPVSLSFNGQVFVDDYEADEDSGKYVQIGTTVYKTLKLSERFSLIPYAGFAFVAESYAFGGGPAERAQYLTRDFGLHFTTATERRWFARMTLAEQSFRRETYRGARLAVIRRF